MSTSPLQLLETAPEKFEESFGEVLETFGPSADAFYQPFYDQFLAGIEYRLANMDGDQYEAETEAALRSYVYTPETFSKLEEEAQIKAARCCGLIFFTGWAWARTALSA